MVITKFPPVESANEHGLLAIGGDLEVESLLLAYKSGIFPWPWDDRFVAWFSPPRRCILYLHKLHISQSLRKFAKRPYFYTKNQYFREVITQCRKPRKREQGTWITDEMMTAYIRLHKAGFCHSYECSDSTGLVGGLYGVRLGQFFAGESMFYSKPNGSKLAFLSLCNSLKEEGISWIDCQVITPLLRDFGAEEISREKFLGLLAAALRGNT